MKSHSLILSVKVYLNTLNTRPEKTIYGDVPEVLLSGNHELIKRWKLKESLRITHENRPDMIKDKNLSDIEIELLNEIKDE